MIPLRRGGVASAHTTGASWELPVGDYVVDVGYDPVQVVMGQYERFDFAVWKDAAKTVPVNFAEVWTRVVKIDTKETLLATGIREQPVGPTTLLYEFLVPGQYSLEVSFRDADGNEIVAASFPIAVSPGEGARAGYVVPAGCAFLGAIVGAALVYLYVRKRAVGKNH